jgi:nucleoside-diphosphate kinase
LSDIEFVLIKPDAVKRGLVGSIMNRFETRGFKFIALKLLKLSRSQAETLYDVHKEKPFFAKLIDHVTSYFSVAMVIQGKEAIPVVRKMVGATNPVEAEVGTMRGDFGYSITQNVIHAADSEKSAIREMEIFFKDYEFLS